MHKTHRIEIDFPIPVDFPPGFEQKLQDLLITVCTAYKRQHPWRVMWPAGWGGKPSGDYTSFNMDVLHVDVAEREDYDWPCRICGHQQGSHFMYISNPPAGNCLYEPEDPVVAHDWRGFRQRMFANRRARIARLRRYKGKFSRERFRHSR